ncbi:hypothetical protein HK105_200699 [Polyrhizophydium stewartii]|uniref:SANTA domain-containing protein n=1 Tax=Polyrhizophydium stewartii TaxID=2732419 RepID=A0ABR4NJT9_9FUNG
MRASASSSSVSRAASLSQIAAAAEEPSPLDLDLGADALGLAGVRMWTSEDLETEYYSLTSLTEPPKPAPAPPAMPAQGPEALAMPRIPSTPSSEMRLMSKLELDLLMDGEAGDNHGDGGGGSGGNESAVDSASALSVLPSDSVGGAIRPPIAATTEAANTGANTRTVNAMPGRSSTTAGTGRNRQAETASDRPATTPREHQQREQPQIPRQPTTPNRTVPQPVSAVAPAHAKLLSDWFLIRKLIPLEEQQRYGESFWIVAAGVLGDPQQQQQPHAAAAAQTSSSATNATTSTTAAAAASTPAPPTSPQSQIWSSSLIAERRTNRTLITSSGKTYVLVGNMNVPEMHSQGFDEIFCQEFADGFPVNWKACVSAVLDRIAKRTRAARKRSAQAAAAASAASAADPAAAQAASAVSVAAATIAAIAAPTEAASLTAAQTAETADAAEASAAAHELYNEPIPTQPPVSQMQESAAPAVDKHDHQGVEAPDPPPPAPAAISIVQASASNATADGNPEPTTDKEGSQAAATASQTAPNPDSDPSEAAPAPMRERLGTTRRTPRSAVQEEEAAIAFPTLTYRSGSDSAFGHAGASAGAGAGSAAMSVQQLLRVSPEASGSTGASERVEDAAAASAAAPVAVPAGAADRDTGRKEYANATVYDVDLPLGTPAFSRTPRARAGRPLHGGPSGVMPASAVVTRTRRSSARDWMDVDDGGAAIDVVAAGNATARTRTATSLNAASDEDEDELVRATPMRRHGGPRTPRISEDHDSDDDDRDGSSGGGLIAGARSDSKVVAAGERQDGSRRVDDDGDSGINKDGDGDDDADLVDAKTARFLAVTPARRRPARAQRLRSAAPDESRDKGSGGGDADGDGDTSDAAAGGDQDELLTPARMHATPMRGGRKRAPASAPPRTHAADAVESARDAGRASARVRARASGADVGRRELLDSDGGDGHAGSRLKAARNGKSHVSDGDRNSAGISSDGSSDEGDQDAVPVARKTKNGRRIGRPRSAPRLSAERKSAARSDAELDGLDLFVLGAVPTTAATPKSAHTGMPIRTPTAAAAAVVSTPASGPMSTQRTRSGRTVMRPLEYWRNERKFVVPIKDAQGRVRAFEPVIVVGSESAMTKIAMRSDGGAPALSASSSSSPSRSANASSAVSRKRARVGGADGGAADAERESKAARRRPDYTDTDSDADAAARGLRSAERRKEQVRVLHTPRRIAVNSGSEGDGGVASDGGGRPRRAVKARK